LVHVDAVDLQPAQRQLGLFQDVVLAQAPVSLPEVGTDLGRDDDVVVMSSSCNPAPDDGLRLAGAMVKPVLPSFRYSIVDSPLWRGLRGGTGSPAKRVESGRYYACRVSLKEPATLALASNSACRIMARGSRSTVRGVGAAASRRAAVTVSRQLITSARDEIDDMKRSSRLVCRRDLRDGGRSRRNRRHPPLATSSLFR
jgi:hypothetical protein